MIVDALCLIIKDTKQVMPMKKTTHAPNVTLELDKVIVEKARMAMIWLAERCDFAVMKDGAGFSGVDAVLGHALAKKTVWSRRETREASRFVVKYKKQIESRKLDTKGVDDLRKSLDAEFANARRLKKRDIVSGSIYVKNGRLVIKTNYHRDLVSRVARLFDRCWDAEEGINTAALCAENAMMAEDLARDFGLTLKKHRGWGKLATVRKVEADGEWLMIRGVSAKNIVYSLPAQIGNPTEDEKVFRGLRVVDSTTIGIPLRSWIIRDVSVWVATMDDDHALGWARNRIAQLCAEAYPRTFIQERERLARAGALRLDSTTEIDKLAARLPDSVAQRLMPHQWAGVRLLAERDEVILADQQGLGKTIEVLAALEARESWPAIVIAPATALLNWRDEVGVWLPHRKVAVLGGGVGKKDHGEPVETADLVILNYESFSKHSDVLQAINPLALVADEAQYLKGHDSARTKAVKQFCADTPSLCCRMITTGTPVMNRPSELLTILTILPDLLQELGGFSFFAARYCRAKRIETYFNSWWDYGGAENLSELANRLRETGGLLRREKSGVLPDLSPKARQTLEVDIVNRDEYDMAQNEFHDWLKTQNKRNKKARKQEYKSNGNANVEADQDWLELLGGADLDFDLGGEDRHEALRKIGALRRLTGIGKIPAAVDWILQHVKDEKLVIFAYHIEVQKALIEALIAAGETPLSITGDQTVRARREAIHSFQREADRSVIVCSLKAAQTAITLTAARLALIVELDWTPAGLEQAEDRIHRIGQTRQVEIAYITARETLDGRMLAILDRKRLIVEKLVSGGALHGYKADGTPRKQAPGPGRPRLDDGERRHRRKSAKAGWQARNSDYMREYMRRRRSELKEATLRQKLSRATKDYRQARRLGVAGMQRFAGASYSEIDYKRDMEKNIQTMRDCIQKLKAMGIQVDPPQELHE